MTRRPELLAATDDEIDSAVAAADPMVLRGLLHQLTGDRTIRDTPVEDVVVGFLETRSMTDPSAIASLRRRAAEYLRALRDAGGEEPALIEERLHESLSLTAGSPIAEADLELWIEQLAVDPFARGMDDAHTLPTEALGDFLVVVIGAGMGGLNAAVHLQRAGVPFTVLERNPDVGGTWFENRYPGARVDSPSRSYAHTYGVDYPMPNPFGAQPENEKYFQWIADTFDLRPRIRFHTEVTGLTWDDGRSHWVVETAGPDGPATLRANVVISGVGTFGRPNIPELPGAADFAGRAVHTSRWPADLDLHGLRVGVIGTGCTGYQAIPEIAKTAARTTVFQRTPNWCFEVEGYLSPFPAELTWLDRNLPLHTNFMRFRASWLYGPESIRAIFDVDPDYQDEHARSALNHRIREQRLEFIRSKLAARPELIEAMIPEAPPLSARPVLIDARDSVFDALTRPDVSLVTADIDHLDAAGVHTADGDHHALDVLVYATGFRPNDYLWPMEVRGRDDARLEDLWAADGARAYLGTMMPGFPNLFLLYGPNTNPTSGLTVLDIEECVTRFAMECIAGLLTQRASAVEVEQDAYRLYNEELDREETTKIYKDVRADNYYRNGHGRSAFNCPIDGRLLWRLLRSPVIDRETGHGIDGLDPRFHHDLRVT
jgi:4-hydroxyacetophenone monooxygenase